MAIGTLSCSTDTLTDNVISHERYYVQLFAVVIKYVNKTSHASTYVLDAYLLQREIAIVTVVHNVRTIQ